MNANPESSPPAPEPATTQGGPAETTASPPPPAVHPQEPPAEPAPQRSIRIGTQRPGVKPPRPAARYEYFSSQAPAAAPVTAAGIAAGSSPQRPAEPTAAATIPSGPVAPPIPAAPAGDVSPPAPVRPQETAPGAAPRPGGRRDQRGNSRDKSPFAGSMPPAKRVAVPNLRAALDEDLERDFEAAFAGVALDALIASATPARADAPLEPGCRMTGTVLSVSHDTAFVDLGERRQGALKLTGFEPDKLPVAGDTVELSIGLRNEDDGLYDVAPANRALSVEDWSQLQAGMVVEARVTAANKGGLECEVAGLRGFMPASLVSTWRIEKLDEMVGQTLESLVTEIVPAARRLVLSRRAVIEKQAAEARAKLLETLQVGDTLEGTVRSVRDFGAFVDIGDGVEGLVHVSQLSWERVSNPAEVLQPGQRVRAVVKKIDRDTGKIGLSVRDLVESPWKRAADKYHVGATVRGVVSRIAQFGAFVRLEPGVEGLVHVSELATRHIRSVGDVVKEGEMVECRVLSVDPDEQRMSLSVKALSRAPETAVASGAEDASAESAAPPAVVKRRNTPLKGGLERSSAGEKFGLNW